MTESNTPFSLQEREKRSRRNPENSETVVFSRLFPSAFSLLWIFWRRRETGKSQQRTIRSHLLSFLDRESCCLGRRLLLQTEKNHRSVSSHSIPRKRKGLSLARWGAALVSAGSDGFKTKLSVVVFQSDSETRLILVKRQKASACATLFLSLERRKEETPRKVCDRTIPDRHFFVWQAKEERRLF